MKVVARRFFLICILFLSLLLLGGGLFLKRGVSIERMTAASVTLHHVSLQWRHKLELQVERLELDLPQDVNAQQSLDMTVVENIIPLMQWVDRLFAKITIQEIRAGDLRADFLYESSAGHLNLSSPLADVRATLHLENGVLLVDVEELNSEKFNSRARGKVCIDLTARTGSGQLQANLADSLPITLEFTGNQDQLTFQGRENGTITTITPFVDLFGLSPNIQRWITDYLTGSRYVLKTFKGDFPWDDPLHLLQSFYAEVRVEDCEYTFAPGLEAIKTEYTDVQFKKGVLEIIPHRSTFYGQDGEDSWLDINFNDFENIILTASILTHAVGNADIMGLLEYYGIVLPFVQSEGKTATDLTLAINLNNEELAAKGRFQIEDGVITYEDRPYRIRDAEVVLEDKHIVIHQIDLGFEDVFQVKVSGYFDGASKEGDIEIVLHEFALPVGYSILELDASAAQPELHYRIHPQGSSVSAGTSAWKVDGFSLQAGAFTTPFSFGHLAGELSPTLFSVSNEDAAMEIEVTLAGSFAGKEQRVDLQGALHKCSVERLLLTSPDVPVRVYYDKGLRVQNKKESQWSVDQIPVTLYPTKVEYSQNVLSVTSDRLSYGEFFDAGISGFYDHTLSKGEFSITEPHLKGAALAGLLATDTTLSVQVDASKEPLRVLVPELALALSVGENKQWSVHMGDLKAVYDHSPLLRQFKVDGGEVTVASADGTEPYLFAADIPWHYSILVADDSPVERYYITGQVDNGKIQARINEKVNLRYSDSIEITSKNISYNLPEISRFLKECVSLQDEEADAENTLLTTLSATDSGLYLSATSRVIADTLILSAVNKTVDMDISSGEGTITVAMEGDSFSLRGEDLNDSFMNALIPGARLRNGRMEVAVGGRFDDFTALFKVEETVLGDFKTLNNVLAFVNTIPALITFSLPDYSSRGLSVSSATVGMKVKDALAVVESVHVDSPELTIVGTGWVDIAGKSIEMDLNLITQSKRNINKIPLVGYILAGKEKNPSIAVKVFGDLLDPEVEHQVFQEVVTVPFGILYRTLALPAHIVSPLFGPDDEEGTGEVGWVEEECEEPEESEEFEELGE